MTLMYILACIFLFAIIILALLWLRNFLFIIPQRPDANANGIQWKVRFWLLFKSRSGGYFVQHIRIRELATSCDDPEFAYPIVNERREFWEAWEVPARQRITQRQLDGEDFDDIFSYAVPVHKFPFNRGKAKLEVWARVRFFEGVTLPQTFIPNNPATRAGQALSDTNRPPFWEANDKGKRHELIYEWNSCQGNPVFTYSEIPKFKE